MKASNAFPFLEKVASYYGYDIMSDGHDRFVTYAGAGDKEVSNDSDSTYSTWSNLNIVSDDNVIKCVIALEEAAHDGWAVFGAGIELVSASEMTCRQKDWSEDDKSKGVDFSQSDFWLVGDNGIYEAVTSVEQMVGYLE